MARQKMIVAHASGFDFENLLYKPIRESEVGEHFDILFPQENGTFPEITLEMVQGAGLVLAEVSRPSLGTGIIIGWADACGVPIIAMSEKGAKVSPAIDNAADRRFEYCGPEDLAERLHHEIWSWLPRETKK